MEMSLSASLNAQKLINWLFLAVGFFGVDVQQNQLEFVVQQIGEAVLASTETVDRLSDRVDALAHQVQQQGYQIFALSDAVQTLAEVQEESLKRLDKLTDVLERLVRAIELPDEPS